MAASAPRTVMAAPIAPAEGLLSVDELVLRDKRRIRGRVLQKEPGRWVILETEDGVHRTFAWDLVEEVNVGPEAGKASSPGAVRSAWLLRTGGAMSYELRVSVTGLALPSKTFGLTGECATGTGMAPASMYGQTASESGRAAGGGMGARLGYIYISPIEPDGASSWWAMRAGAGLDLQVLHSQIPIGTRPIAGELCSRIAQMRHEIESKSSPVVLAHVPLTFGAHVGLGRFDEAAVWRGVVLGAAWVPSYVQIWPWVGDASSHFNPLGIELTVDLATLRATSTKRSPEPQFRISVYFAPSIDTGQPTMGMLGFGPAWY